MKSKYDVYIYKLKTAEQYGIRGLKLIDLMKKAKLKGNYKIQGECGDCFCAIWEKAKNAKFEIRFYAHCGDDAIQMNVCYN